jgi:hypothetical protein
MGPASDWAMGGLWSLIGISVGRLTLRCSSCSRGKAGDHERGKDPLGGEGCDRGGGARKTEDEPRRRRRRSPVRCCLVWWKGGRASEESEEACGGSSWAVRSDNSQRRGQHRSEE